MMESNAHAYGAGSGCANAADIMNNEKRSQHFTRASILELLSDDEVARVTSAESPNGLSEGDEYIDLENLDQGVCVARGVVTPMGNMVARKTLPQNTWGNILTHMSSRRIAPQSEAS